LIKHPLIANGLILKVCEGSPTYYVNERKDGFGGGIGTIKHSLLTVNVNEE
jgi:hypothetical protein